LFHGDEGILKTSILIHNTLCFEAKKKTENDFVQIFTSFLLSWFL